MNDAVRDVSIWMEVESLHVPYTIKYWIDPNPGENVKFPQKEFLERIPEKFLQGFVSLRVLNLSGTRIRALPPPLLVLSELRALILKDCICLWLLPSMDALTKLHLLDAVPKNIPAGTVSKLCSLEVLHMQQSSYTLMVEGSEAQNQVTFTELVTCMKKVVEISIKLESTPFQDNEALDWLKRLKRFEIFIGSTTYSGYQSEEHDSKRMIFSGLHLPTRKVGRLLINVSSLVLHNFPDLAWLSKDLAASLSTLQHHRPP